jgi:hypothetical protein
MRVRIPLATPRLLISESPGPSPSRPPLTEAATLAGTTPTQVSRKWLTRYQRPRGEGGQFAPGHILWSRPADNASRWLWWPKQPEYGGWPGPVR